ncbi:hypothetical protein BGZ59_005113 [Podila verticillata]|nr:hypothetical protein BGZ59_005113 [Podila verticillata]
MTKRQSSSPAKDVDMAPADTAAKKAKVGHDHAYPQDIYTIESDFLKNSKFEILYMACRARAEVPRYLLEYVGAKYTSKAPVNWPAGKKNTPFGVLPILTHHKPNGDELEIPETGSFVRYLGRLFGLDGDTLEEQVTVDVFYQAAADNLLNICFQELWNKPDPTDKDVISNCFAKLEPFFDGFEKYLVKNGSNGYVIKEKTTYADFSIFDWMNHFFEAYSDHMTKLVSPTVRPALHKLYTRLDSHPRIRAYIEGGRWEHRPSVPLLSLYSAGINVTDYEKSLEFYTKKVGLTCVLNVAPPGFGEKERYLELTTKKDGSGTKFTIYCPGTSLEKFQEKYKIPTTSAVAFNVADVKDAHDRLVKNGVEFSMPPANMPWGSLAMFNDPDGNKISLTSTKQFQE